jgi:hypothetical protein
MKFRKLWLELIGIYRLGDIEPDWERSRYIRRGAGVMLKPYYHDLQEKKHGTRQTTLLSY